MRTQSVVTRHGAALLLAVAASATACSRSPDNAPAGGSPPSAESLQMTGVELVNVPVDAEAAARRLAGGVRFATISNQDRADFDEEAFRGYHDYLAKTYPRAHRAMRRELIGDPRAFSLLYTWTGSNPDLPPIVLMGHQDVVPVVPETEAEWKHGAFAGDIADGYVWGRGASDDKLSIQSILEAIEMHLAQGFVPTRTIYLAFGQDEEVGGPEGARHLVQALEARGVTNIALVLDEGVTMSPGLLPGVDRLTALIGIAEKGYVSLQLRVAGLGGHSSMPPDHSNIGILATAIDRLEASPFPNRITDAVREQFRFLGSALPAEQRASLANDSTFLAFLLSAPMTKAMVHTTTAVTMVSGGIKENVMPPVATAVVNFRILQGETIASVIDRVKSVIGDDRVEVTDISASIDPSPVSSTGGPEYRAIERSIRQIWGSPDQVVVVPNLVIGGNDAKYFAASPIAKNVYRFTPQRLESFADNAMIHGVNERVLVAEYAKSIGFFYQLIANCQAM